MKNLTKEEALEALEARKANRPKRINNSDLRAGSPMYFYCNHCGATSDVLPENFISRPRHICDNCQYMKDKGWLND